MKHQHHIPWSCVALLLVGIAWLPAAEQAAKAPAKTAVETPDHRDDRSPFAREARQYLAQLTEERNHLREINDGLKSQQWLLVIYGVAMTALTAWLMVLMLRRPVPARAKPNGDTDVFGGPGTAVTVRKNATITIRNSSTQKAEVVEQVQTRAAFARTDATPRQGTTRRLTRTQTSAETTEVTPPAAELIPASAATPPLTRRTERPPAGTAPNRPPTVRVEAHSDRLEAVEVSVKPGTGAMRRDPVPAPRQGLTIIEVMIALMVFSLVLSAIASSWFSLRSLQKQSQAEAKVHELAQTLSERIIGANWDWIGRDRPDEQKTMQVPDPSIIPQTDPPTMKTITVTERYWRRYAWSWNRRELPRDGTPGTTTRLPPLTDHNWTTADYDRFRADPIAPLTPLDVDQYDVNQDPAKRINPHNLIDLGFIDRPTGLPNLQVYVEYYRAGLLDSLFTFSETSTEKYRDYFKKITTGQDPLLQDLIFPESPFQTDPLDAQMNTADQKITLQALVVRIIVTWGDQPKEHRHELVMARRK